MPAAPLPPDEAKRIAALLRCNVLDTGPEAAFDDLSRFAAEVCETPIALVSLVDENRQWFKSHFGVDVSETPRSQAFCGYAILSDEPFIIRDATLDPRTADNPLVTDAPGIRFYAGVPLRVSSGEALGTLCVIDLVPRDIADEQLAKLKSLALQVTTQLELRLKLRDLETARSEALRASESKSMFLANMSHEIRTPLTAILGFADMVSNRSREQLEESQIEEAIQTIQRNGQHLLAIINDILDVSKIEAGRMSIESISTDIVRIVDEVVALVRRKAAQADLTLSIEYASPMPRRISTDPTRLQQILLNLVGNAVKFTQQGFVTIRCSADAERRTVRFEVVDSGIGMTSEQLTRIKTFEPFNQADQNTTRCFGGTGLGLRISHLLAKALGGDLSVESIEGSGTTVTATIGLEETESTEWFEPGISRSTRCSRQSDLAIPATSTPSLELRPLLGRRILIAEDGPDNQRLIAFVLQAAGAQVEICENGSAAVVAMSQRDANIDLVLMDMHMPVMDGYEATRTLRAQGCTTPIFALTANAMKGDRERSLEAGCDGFLTKPIDRGNLIEECRAALLPTEQL